MKSVLQDWDRRFSKFNRYYKDNLIISAVPECSDVTKIDHWHLESVCPSKPLGNFKSLDEAKDAGDKEIERVNNQG